MTEVSSSPVTSLHINYSGDSALHEGVVRTSCSTIVHASTTSGVDQQPIIIRGREGDLGEYCINYYHLYSVFIRIMCQRPTRLDDAVS